MGIELRYTCLNRKPSQSTRLPPGVSGTSRTSGNLASDRPDWVVCSPRRSAYGKGKSGHKQTFTNVPENRRTANGDLANLGIP